MIRLFLICFMIVLPFQSVSAEDIHTLCRKIANHKPKPGVHYQPGVDVKGNAVAPADLNSNFNFKAKPIVIPIKIDLLERFEIDLPQGFELEPEVANFTIHPDGRVEYNGEEVTQRAGLVCAQERAKSLKSKTPKIKQKNGQTGIDVIDIEPVKTVPPQEPLWTDGVLTGDGE